MQCNQPLFCTGFQNTQFSPYHTQPYHTLPYPDIIGEGDVLSYTLPDGNVQCYFVPINRRIPHWTSSYYTPSNKEAWFVRSIFNTFQATGLNQPSNTYGETFLRSNFNSPSCGFVQKFHNDGWTSTTDLQYFFPALRHDWTKGCAAIQVEIPSAEKTIYHYGTACSRPCDCHKVGIPKIGPKRSDTDCTETPMCIDEVKSTHCCCDDTRTKVKKHSKNHSNSCACPRAETADKVVATCADRASGCCDPGPSAAAARRVDIETEVWYPRRRKSRRSEARSSRAATASDSACCLACDCSDTERLGRK